MIIILRSCKASKINAALAFWLLKRYSNGASDEELAKALDDLLSCYVHPIRAQSIHSTTGTLYFYTFYSCFTSLRTGCLCYKGVDGFDIDQIIENVSHLKDIIRAICEVAGDVVNDYAYNPISPWW
ncbi:hypothetical protein GQX74_005701 [Glossina fuscipes]|nr:hypothetical protein GQX74_005701 [Glossina fuscipes]